MPRKLFDRELENLIARISEMGDAVDRKIGQTITALRTADQKLAGEVAGSDGEVDRMEHSIEKLCMELIARQQPIAGDLRMIAACLKILTDIEREGDQCADICEILTIGELNTKSLAASHVVHMLEMTRGMFRRAMNVFLSRDVGEAYAVCKSDDEVDAMFSKIILEVCGIIAERPRDVMREVDLLFISKYAERLGDHSTNIAEWVIFMETGVHPDLNDSEP